MKRLAVLSFTIATLIAPTFSQAASGLDATQPAVEATTKAEPPQKPTPWWEWWKWLRFAGGGR
jgi:predicted S18 family serine protease